MKAIRWLCFPVLWSFLSCPNGACLDLDDRLETARAAYEAGDLGGALGQYEAILKDEPQQLTALQMAGHIRYRAMDYKGARSLFRMALTLREDSFTLLMLGNIALQNFEPVLARRYYLKALAQDPLDRNLKDNLSLAEERIGRAQEVARHYKRTQTLFWGGILAGAAAVLAMVYLEVRGR